MVMALNREWSDQPCKTLLFSLLSTQTARLKISCINRIDYIRLTTRRISLTSFFKLHQSQHPPPPPPPPTWKMFLETREERNSLQSEEPNLVKRLKSLEYKLQASPKMTAQIFGGISNKMAQRTIPFCGLSTQKLKQVPQYSLQNEER